MSATPERTNLLGLSRAGDGETDGQSLRAQPNELLQDALVLKVGDALEKALGTRARRPAFAS